MRLTQAAVVAMGILGFTSMTAAAQEPTDQWVFAAMMFTPYGPLPRIVTPTLVAASDAADRPSGTIEFKYGRWQIVRADLGTELRFPVRSIKTDLVYNAFSAGVRFANVGITAGYETCEPCMEGIVMAGLDYPVTLVRAAAPLGARSSFALGVHPSVGASKVTGMQDIIAFTAAVDVPASLVAYTGRRARIVPHIAPGVVYGQLKLNGEAASGTRFALGGGLSFLPSAEFSLNVTWRTIFDDEKSGALGFGVSYGPERKR